MTKAWMLLVLLNTGELQIYPMATELACDSQRQEMDLLARNVTTGIAPVMSECIHAFVEPEAMEGGE